jgi:iron(III) transport system substrate-binding protein
MLKNTTLIMLGLMLSVLLAACGGAPAAAPAPAAPAAPAAEAPAASGGEADTIVIYTAIEDDQIAEYRKLFEAKYPNINLNIVRDSTGIITARLLAEKDNPQADVVWGLAATSLLVADQEGMLEPYAPAGLERVETRFRDPSNPPTWVGIDVWMSAFCVNTIEAEAKGLPIPTSWEDLTDPVYEGSIVMSNPASSGTGFLSVSAILQMMGEEEGWKYLDALHNNIAQYTHSGSKPCRMAGAGEFPIGISFDFRGISQKQAGEPIEVVFPTEGSGWDMEANALVKKDTIKPAAKTFLDWAISDEIMQLYAQNYSITSVPTGLPIAAEFPKDPVAQLIENDFNWAAANRDRILEEWIKKYDSKSEPK